MIEQRLRVMRTLWGGLLASSLALPAVGALAAPGGKAAAQTMLPALPYALGVTSLFVAAVSFVLPAMNSRKVLAILPIEPSKSFDGEARLPAASWNRLLLVSQTGLILAMALSLSISLYGLVLQIQHASWQTSGPFFAAGSLLVLVRFPTLDGIVGPLERLRGVRVHRGN